MSEENWDDDVAGGGGGGGYNYQPQPQYSAPIYTETYESSSRKQYGGGGGGGGTNWRNNDQQRSNTNYQSGGGGWDNNQRGRNNSYQQQQNGRDGNQRDRNSGGGGGFYQQSGGRDNNQQRGGGGNYHDGGQRNNNYGGGGRQDGGNATLMKVPTKCVGRIIGKGGSKINDLQFESGAKIFVTKDTEGDETVVKIIGDAEAVTKAQSLIGDLTVERERPAPITFQESRGDEDTRPLNEISAAPTDWQARLRECDRLEKEAWAKLPSIKKEFYVEHPDVTAQTDEEVTEFRMRSNNIVVERTFKTDDSKPIPKPVRTFVEAFHNYPDILTEIAKAGFEKPSPIQCQSWPVLLSGEDLIGIAQTGTGKTLAFLLPALIHIDGQMSRREDRRGPAVLVMAPTRELALQIEKETKKYEYKGIKAVCIYGGASRRDQINIVTSGVDIVIATPGRLNDLVAADHLDVKYVTYVVLDEADRMLDMGFEPQIRKVMYAIRPARQTVMTSATWPMGVRRLAQSYMVDPIQVYIGSLDLAAVHTVKQIIEVLPDDDADKFNFFMNFAYNLGPDDKIIVFCGKKARADDLSSELNIAGLSCQTLHGDRDQSDREQALLDIADGTVKILIATDLASRGLDIDDITHVVNYDFPRNIEEYVHRVGRTGRAGKSGTSVSYFTKADWGQAKELISILEEAEQYIPEEIYGMAERHEVWKAKKDANRPPGGRPRFNNGGGGGGGGGGYGRKW